MKILGFVDIHGSMKALDIIIKKSAKADVIVGAGDFTIFGQEIGKILKKLDNAGKPVLIIPGNHELAGELKKASSGLKNIHFIHKTRFEFDDYLFLGYEGSGFAMNDLGFKSMEKKFKEFMKKSKKIILVTHAPPHGTRLDKLMGKHCGNKTIRNFIEENKILLAISGHLHENAGKQDMIKKTLVVNPGPYGKLIKV